MNCAEIKYHRNCYSQFLLCGRKVGFTENKDGRPECQIKCKAFEQVVNYLENNDESQYSLSEIQDLFCSYLPNNENSYTDQWLKKKLKDYFGNDVIITEGNGTSIITFKENGYSILKEGWKTKKMSNEEEKCLIIDMAAAIIRDSISQNRTKWMNTQI